jgi:uracil-DNA glycosylase
LLNSYHCSRYNTQTRSLTTPMFEAIIERALVLVNEGAPGRDEHGSAR